jgi:hypothetical protein
VYDVDDEKLEVGVSGVMTVKIKQKHMSADTVVL